MHPARLGVRRRILFGELADLRAGEALVSARSGEARRGLGPSQQSLDRTALIRRARVQPHRRAVARERSRQLRRERAVRIERAPHVRRGPIEIHAAVLLRRAGNRLDPRDLVTERAGDHPDHAIERIGPQEGGRPHLAWIVAVEDAGAGPVLRKVAIEVQRVLKDDAPGVAIDFQNNGSQALGRGVEAEIQHCQFPVVSCQLPVAVHGRIAGSGTGGKRHPDLQRAGRALSPSA